MNEIERALSDVESLFVDPALNQFLNDAKDMNEIVREKPISDDEARSLLDEMNQQWRDASFYDQKMYVTGDMYVGGQFHEVEYQDTSLEAYKNTMVNQSFKAHGFSLINMVSEDDNGVNVQQQLVLRGVIKTQDEAGIKGISYENCGIILDRDVIIECKARTPAKVAAWLDVYYPEVKCDIDQSLSSATNEADATMNLRELSIPMIGTKKSEIKQQQKYIELYLRHNNRYEQYVPYLVELLGECQIFTHDNGGFVDSTIMSERKSLLLIANLFVRTDYTAREFMICAEATLIQSGKKRAQLINMPLKTFMSIESTRDIVRDH
ncbi:hypothetical protein H7200_01885 [Candidatus Saccharibacteria bacterium]|nr:hypothetical protein [Candidatus Saccharibacteria bacterium]